MTYWSAHTHSKYSATDALPSVEKVVATASSMGYPALGLTDHGNMGGAARLYAECRKEGIKPLPGIEAYVQVTRGKGQRRNLHMGMLATSHAGYMNLVGLTNQAHRQFYYRPVIDLADIAQAGRDGRLEGIAALSGCWFGILPTLLREGDPTAVRNLLTALDSWFGAGLYVEMQVHNVEGNDEVRHAELLHGLAGSLGLPCVITQDSHYCSLDDKPQHDMMKRLFSWDKEPDSGQFPGDGYHMVDVDWMRTRYTQRQLDDGMAGLADLEAKADVVIPELDEFKLAVPRIVLDPDATLRKNCADGFEALLEKGAFTASKERAYRARMEEELSVVVGAGFSGYLLLAQAVCDFMRDKEILFSVRGSAPGSLLCWLLGITTLDPLKWNLPFDRFLSRDRTKPPDIDLDIEHRRRDEVIEWISSRYHTVRIGTWAEMKLHYEEDDGEDKGALIVKWQAMNRKLGGDGNVKPEGSDLRLLKELAVHKPFGNYGVHAAGLMITPDEATAACVPLMYAASSKTMVTSFDMDDIERLGFVKLDLLNGKTMTALHIAFDLTGVEWSEIPFDDSATYSLIRSKPLTALFQLEGSSFARGIRQMRPRKFSDLIAAMALFRPAALKSGATERYLSRRAGKEDIPQRHPIITEETKETYGVIVYQEQVLNIMKRIGLTVEDIEKVRKALKSSNDNVERARKTLSELQEKIQLKASEAGMGPLDVAWLNDAVNAYADYGFNKAHSTSYAIMAYTTAYMRCHYPLEFWAGMLDAYGDSQTKTWYRGGEKPVRMKQPAVYERAAIDDGVRILPVHINKSRKSWTVEPRLNAIRKGLETVDHAGPLTCAEIEAHQPFTSLDDIAARVSARRVSGANPLGEGRSPAACGGVIAALAEVGALQGLERDPEIAAERARIQAQKEAKAAERAARKAEREAKAQARAAHKSKESTS